MILHSYLVDLGSFVSEQHIIMKTELPGVYGLIQKYVALLFKAYKIVLVNHSIS